MKRHYDDSEKFDEVIRNLHDSLGKKYHIQEYGFDVECIYEEGDLTKLVTEMLALGQFKYEFVKDGLDNARKQYYSIFKVADSSYEFRTSSEGDYVDLETVFPGLEQIAKNNKPEYEYNYSNLDGGQIAFLIFSRTSDLVQAVDEGYPCSLKSGQWRWEKEWKWGVYSDIKLGKVPNYADLKEKYYETLKELYEKDFNVPNLTINRIYIGNLLENKSIDIAIDGEQVPASFNDITDNTVVHCFWDSWGLS